MLLLFIEKKCSYCIVRRQFIRIFQLQLTQVLKSLPTIKYILISVVDDYEVNLKVFCNIYNNLYFYSLRASIISN